MSASIPPPVPTRVVDPAVHYQSGATEPPRVVITQTPDAALVCWHVEPGQRIELHSHPHGQDIWIIQSGEGRYFTDASGAFQPLRPGVVAIAARGELHGALNTGTVPLRFVSVVSPAESGFEPAGFD